MTDFIRLALDARTREEAERVIDQADAAYMAGEIDITECMVVFRIAEAI